MLNRRKSALFIEFFMGNDYIYNAIPKKDRNGTEK
jgi:hypothetical protein